jgi:hypothetical protein
LTVPFSFTSTTPFALAQSEFSPAWYQDERRGWRFVGGAVLFLATKKGRRVDTVQGCGPGDRSSADVKLDAAAQKHQPGKLRLSAGSPKENPRGKLRMISGSLDFVKSFICNEEAEFFDCQLDDFGVAFEPSRTVPRPKSVFDTIKSASC